jgi:hypothetical protein
MKGVPHPPLIERASNLTQVGGLRLHLVHGHLQASILHDWFGRDAQVPRYIPAITGSSLTGFSCFH